MQKRVLGPEHPDTLHTSMSFAAALNDQGRHAEAASMHCETLGLRKPSLGPEHPDTLSTVGSLANSLCSQGQRAEAVAMRRKRLSPSTVPTSPDLVRGVARPAEG